MLATITLLAASFGSDLIQVIGAWARLFCDWFL